MSVVIRMKRTGRKNAPCYRISVADSRNPRDGRTLETLGIYDPISPKDELRLRLDIDRARYWLSKGALPSHTVHSIFTRENVYEGQAPAKPRTRDGRRKDTATAKRRQAAKAGRAERKQARQAERIAAKRAAKQAAAEGEGEGDE